MEKLCETCRQRLPVDEFSRNPTTHDKLWGSCKRCTATHNLKKVIRGPQGRHPVTIAPNLVFEGLLEAMKKYGREWYYHISYEDYRRVQMEIWGMANKISSVWKKTVEAEIDMGLENMKRHQEELRVTARYGPSNPKARFLADQFYQKDKFDE